MSEEAAKKKILIFIPEFPVLSETFIEREISKLVESGKFEIEVLSLKKGQGFYSENLASRVRYIKLRVTDIIRGYFYFRNRDTFKTAYKTAMSNNQRVRGDALYLFVKSLGYALIFKERSPDEIHAHFLSEPSTLALLVSQLLSVPFSISAHARDVFGNNADRTLNPELVPEKATYARFIAVCNKKAWEKCRELSGMHNPGNIILHYHGVDPKLITEISGDTQLLPQKPLVFSVGRLVEKKGFSYLIKASALLKERKISHQVFIAGPGRSMYDELKRQIEEAGLNDTIQILGGGEGISNIEALKYMKNARVFVLPSIETGDGDAEGVPNTLIEAAFSRVPIVSTMSGSIPELIKNEENGLLVVQKNEYALADAIEKLLLDSSLAQKLADNAYLTVAGKFDLNINIKELESLFSG